MRTNLPRFRRRHAAGSAIAIAAGLAFLAGPAVSAAPAPAGKPWVRHTIDAETSGADGVKLGDINGDGHLDIVTGWEEGDNTRLYLNPGPKAARQPWPRVVVGSTPSVEDAVFADLDGDGMLDIVSSTEGSSRKVFVHWAPGSDDRLLDSAAWRQDVFPTLSGLSGWMFAEPMQIDGRHGADLVIGSRVGRDTPRAMLGWLEAPANPRDAAAWRWHPLIAMQWTMSINLEDMDGDGDRDILYGERRKAGGGVHWLENPGPAQVTAPTAWKKHLVGAAGVEEVMLLDTGDVDGDGLRDVAVAIRLARADNSDPSRHSRIAWYRRVDRSGRNWQEHQVIAPGNTGPVKSVAIGDVDRDGKSDFVVSCEAAVDGRIGVYWLRQGTGRADGEWTAHDIGGPAGIKFDLVRLLDLDADGDLDVATCEEREAGRGLGVFWYENPGAPGGRATAVPAR